MEKERHLIGVLGGMGPAATVDFVHKLIALTNAECDQDHLPLLIASIPDVPDRTAALLRHESSPETALVRYRMLLENAGARCIVMPCNTAHFWLDKLREGAQAEILSIIDAVVTQVKKMGVTRIGLMATDGTVTTGLYQKQLAQNHIDCVLPDKAQQEEIMRSIYLLKTGHLERATVIMEEQYQQLMMENISVVILGCTEIPVILATAIQKSPERFIDSNEALAHATIRWYEEKTGKRCLSC